MKLFISLYISFGNFCVTIYFTKANKVYYALIVFHIYLSDLVMYGHKSIFLYVEVQVMIVGVEPTIERYIKKVTINISLLELMGRHRPVCQIIGTGWVNQ